MYNDLFSIGPLTFHTYGLMSAIGIIAAYFVLESRIRKKGLDDSHLFGLLIACLVFGYAGSKLLYIITILPLLASDPDLFLHSLSNGWVIFGGLLGGILGGYLFCRWKKLPSWKFFDVGMPAVALAQGFGRIGCFFAGCCYGVETSGPVYLEFSHSDYAPNGIHLVPTQLISSAVDFCIFAFLSVYDKKWKKKDGEDLALYLILYSGARIIVEFWRGDLIRGAVGPFSTSQFIGLFTLAAGIIIFVMRRKDRNPESAEAQEEAVTETEEAGTQEEISAGAAEAGTREKAAAEPTEAVGSADRAAQDPVEPEDPDASWEANAAATRQDDTED
ncbi:prolipoprotein diacylglyceryl transferase [Bilifractor porci]|uniref:Phosphatidylglycerol--prolipoprotein diacylglyceryl transferase n=1 Tax=Bilifractor porci TaxID=2606636 RepID=A0A7X2P9B8_9FIRM|nr:prolipoprotein diacylglyceryl transferase [Bilifractor porci]